MATQLEYGDYQQLRIYVIWQILEICNEWIEIREPTDQEDGWKCNLELLATLLSGWKYVDY